MRSSLLLLLALAACNGPTGEWTYDDALRPIVTHLDRDGDGVVELNEYNRVSYLAPRFQEVDSDGDGALCQEEIRQLILRQDPSDFDGQVRDEPDLPVEQPEIFHPDPWRVRILKELFQFWREEVRTRDPGLPLPDDATITAAAATGTLDSLECEAVLRSLRQACTAVGLSFPERLSR